MKLLAVMPVLAIAMTCVGCSDPSPSPGPVSAQASAPVAGKPENILAPAASDRPAKGVLLVRLSLATIEVPVGAASGSEDIWSYVDEEPVAAANAAILGLNGVRIGLGRQNHWADVARVLQKLTGRPVKQSSLIAFPGNPVALVLKEHQPEQTVFTYYDDQTLTGADYPPGDNLLTIACTLDPDEPARVVLTGMPQIRTTQRVNRIVTEPGGIPTIMAKPVLYPMSSMTFQFSVPNKDFIVIGPGVESRRPNSVGRLFLLRDREGMEFETVLALMPETFSAQPR